MNIIKADINHLDILTPLFDGYMVFYRQPSNPEQYRKFLETRIENQEADLFIALNDHGQGMGFTLLYPSFSSVSQGSIYILNDLFVHKDHRRKGVATKLMNAAEEFSRSAGAIRLHLSTEASNHSAQALYERAGWRRETNFFYYINL